MQASEVKSSTRARHPAAMALSHPADRALWALLFMCGMGVLVVAAMLQPDAEGYGTHTQLGMQPCASLAATGFPCPTCGMTTAFAHAADGNLVAAFATQPAGAALALLAAIATLVSGYGMLAGLPVHGVAEAVWTPRNLLIFGGGIILAWIYKILAVHGVL